MDVARPIRPKRSRRAILFVGLGVAVASAATVAFASLRAALPTVPRSSVRLERVRRGAFVREVAARGTLVPESIQWITADGPARVARIAVAPGASVDEGATLVELVNAELELATLDAERAAAAARSDLATLEVRSGADLLATDAALAGLRTNADVMASRATASVALASEGLVPALDRDEAGARAAVAAQQASLESKRRTLLAEGNKRQIASQRTEVEKLDQVARFRKKQLDALEVPAPAAGVVQELPLEPGQWVTAGTVLAKIAKPGRLKAILQVPEGVVTDVAIGQRVSLDMPGAKAEGKVSRVDPSVQGGVVRVEVALDDPALEGARADLAVTATIEIERVDDALVVARQAGIAPGGAAELFKLDAAGSSAERTRIRFGRGSVREIEVIDGLSEGDTVVLGEMERLVGGARAIALVDER
ncbi:MAG: HlyD family efflux transporter periplasmic adaptor subunit [Polyangiaceae bacterium]|nr:HlyD family efflux transporter periplasmic adaptor subunit [Polyangiaceae bacterium]